jgi:hypothetical protein
MTSPDTRVLQQRLVRVITRRRGSSTGAAAVAVAARLTHGDLTAALDPLISSSGVEALWGRAFDLAQREYPAGERRGERRDEDRRTDESFAQVTRWLEAQVPSAATEAAAALFATFAELLAALIGESLTTRYLEKAWPDGFSDTQPKGKKA